MTEGIVFIGCSIDGYIARANGDIDWLDHEAPEGEDYGYGALMEHVDGIIMGRATYQKVLTFEGWTAPKQTIVMSSTMTQDDVPAEHSGVVWMSGQSPREAMEALTREGWGAAYIDGGRLIQSFLREGLIQRLIITRIPILLGTGIPLFGPLDADLPLTHVKTESYASGLVQSTYDV